MFILQDQTDEISKNPPPPSVTNYLNFSVRKGMLKPTQVSAKFSNQISFFSFPPLQRQNQEKL